MIVYLGNIVVGDITLWVLIFTLGLLCGDAPTILVLVEVGDPVLLTATGGFGLCLNVGEEGTNLEGDIPLLKFRIPDKALVLAFYDCFLKR